MRDQVLQSQIVPVGEITESDTRAMYEIFARHYDCVSLERFASDLAEKDCALVLRNGNTDICGFSTQKLLRGRIGATPVRAVFSGDTIVDRAHWGEQELGRCWCRYVSSLYSEEPGVPLYWFLISKGYRTYLYLPLFFETFYPNFQTPTPEFERCVLDTLATAKFPLYYRRDTRVIEFPESQGQLKPHLAEIPARRLRHPHVQFFLRCNPRFAEGCELACLAEISPSNMKLFAGRMLQQTQAYGLYQGAD